MSETRPAPRSTTMRYVVLAALLVAVAVAWTVAWNFLAGRADARLQRHLARLAERGTVFTCAERSIAGYPFRFEVDCAKPRLVIARAGDIEFAAERLRLVGMIWQPLKLVSFLDGPATLRDPATGALYDATWTATEGSIGFATLNVDRVSAVFDDLAIAESGVERPARLAARHLEFHGRPAAGPDAGAEDVDLALTAEELVLSDGAGHDLPPLALTADTTARNVLGAAIGARRQSDFLKRWQAADGALEIVAARLAVGSEFLAAGTGRLRLDGSGRLVGNIDANIAGIEKLLGGNGNILATLGTALLGPASELEGRPARAAKLRFDAGRVNLGPLTISELPPLY